MDGTSFTSPSSNGCHDELLFALPCLSKRRKSNFRSKACVVEIYDGMFDQWCLSACMAGSIVTRRASWQTFEDESARVRPGHPLTFEWIKKAEANCSDGFDLLDQYGQIRLVETDSGRRDTVVFDVRQDVFVVRVGAG